MSDTEKIKTHWFDKKLGRSIVTTGLTIITAVSAGLITRFEDAGLTGLFIGLTVVSIILQAIFSARCGVFDKAREISVEETNEKIKVYKKLFEQLPPLLDRQAEGINKIAKNIQDNGIIPADRWTFDDASTYVCASILSFIKDYTQVNGPVNVYYVKATNDQGTEIKMVGCANDLGNVPDPYMISKPVREGPNEYFDVKMFARKSLKAEYRLNKQDVDNAFYYADREKESGKCEQFLFIPVSCDKKKMIGMIEIMVASDYKIAEQESDMKNIQKLLKVYSSIFVLLHKAEKAAIALPTQSDNASEEGDA